MKNLSTRWSLGLIPNKTIKLYYLTAFIFFLVCTTVQAKFMCEAGNYCSFNELRDGDYGNYGYEKRFFELFKENNPVVKCSTCNGAFIADEEQRRIENENREQGPGKFITKDQAQENLLQKFKKANDKFLAEYNAGCFSYKDTAATSDTSTSLSSGMSVSSTPAQTFPRRVWTSAGDRYQWTGEMKKLGTFMTEKDAIEALKEANEVKNLWGREALKKHIERTRKENRRKHLVKEEKWRLSRATHRTGWKVGTFVTYDKKYNGEIITIIGEKVVVRYHDGHNEAKIELERDSKLLTQLVVPKITESVKVNGEVGIIDEVDSVEKTVTVVFENGDYDEYSFADVMKVKKRRRLPENYDSLRPSEQALARQSLTNRPKTHIQVLEKLLEEINRLNRL